MRDARRSIWRQNRPLAKAPKSVTQKSRADLQAATTRQLLGYLARLRELPDLLDDREWSAEELRLAREDVAEKSDPRWQVAFAEVKAELATREHVPRAMAGSRKADRQAVQRAKQTR